MQIAAVWKMIPLCLVWCIWVERNGRCFEVKERLVDVSSKIPYFSGLRLLYSIELVSMIFLFLFLVPNM